ncbi:hypothetical protein V8F33_006671 [Rhypophila sp. PSN 637]
MSSNPANTGGFKNSPPKGGQNQKNDHGDDDSAKRTRDTLVKLPFEEGTPKLIDHNQVTHKPMGESHDVLQCTGNPDKINWRASSYRKGDPCSQMALVEPTMAGRNAIANTFDAVVRRSELLKQELEDKATAASNTVIANYDGIAEMFADEDSTAGAPSTKPTSASKKTSKKSKDKGKGKAQPGLAPSTDLPVPSADPLMALEMRAEIMTSKCVRCYRTDHRLSHCPFPDKSNYMTALAQGCAVCNTTEHRFDDCPEVLKRVNIENGKRVIQDLDFFFRYLIANRVNKCPLYSEHFCWTSLRSICRDKPGTDITGFPWTLKWLNLGVQTTEVEADEVMEHSSSSTVEADENEGIKRISAEDIFSRIDEESLAEHMRPLSIMIRALVKEAEEAKVERRRRGPRL